VIDRLEVGLEAVEALAGQARWRHLVEMLKNCFMFVNDALAK